MNTTQYPRVSLEPGPLEHTNHEATAPPPSSTRPTLKYGDVHEKFNFSRTQDP